MEEINFQEEIELFDAEAEQMTKEPREKFFSKNKKLLTIPLIIMLTILMILFLSCVILFSNVKVNENIHLTTEYQIVIPEDVLSKWKSRDTEMRKWMEYFEENSEYFKLSNSEINSGTRYQYYIDTKGKNKCYEIRVREFVDGFMAGATTVDIKGNSKFEYFANQYNFTPSPTFAANSSQKLERDEHGCDHKYSRETRIYLEERKQFDTCLDVVEMFPYAYDSLKAPTLMNKVTTKGDAKIWFEQEYSGILDSDTMYKVAFTLKYKSVEEAQNESAAPYFAEWSIRIYTVGEGFSGIYNKNVKSDIVHAWQKLIDNYGNDCECTLCF